MSRIVRFLLNHANSIRRILLSRCSVVLAQNYAYMHSTAAAQNSLKCSPSQKVFAWLMIYVLYICTYDKRINSNYATRDSREQACLCYAKFQLKVSVWDGGVSIQSSLDGPFMSHWWTHSVVDSSSCSIGISHRRLHTLVRWFFRRPPQACNLGKGPSGSAMAFMAAPLRLYSEDDALPDESYNTMGLCFTGAELSYASHH